MGNPSAGRLRRWSLYFAVVHLIHCRRVRRRDLLAKGRLPYDCLEILPIILLFSLVFIFACYHEYQ
ncbi:MAG: hypothetical protein LBK82_10165 [Planctomycetaceae bacterium]|nr:hypothetical protein [Planctomycetaceae bacterium]